MFAQLCWAKSTLAVLQAFDDLLLLKSGGLVTYHGSLGKNSCRLIEYFQVSLPASQAQATEQHPLLWMQPCKSASEMKASAADVGLMLWLCQCQWLICAC